MMVLMVIMMLMIDDHGDDDDGDHDDGVTVRSTRPWAPSKTSAQIDTHGPKCQKKSKKHSLATGPPLH